jgi:uroporphyrin-III C-methyltransferase/precorrin-2 dehydrogenase/sirohydrochlorin ferrochelatase
VRFVTAHSRTSVDLVDWAGIARSTDTLALYMGVAAADHIESQLLRHGRAPTTPVAFIENGTRTNQRIVVGTLRGVAELAARAQVQSPALLIVGEVAHMALNHHWFGAAPVGGVAESMGT